MRLLGWETAKTEAKKEHLQRANLCKGMSRPESSISRLVPSIHTDTWHDGAVPVEQYG